MVANEPRELIDVFTELGGRNNRFAEVELKADASALELSVNAEMTPFVIVTVSTLYIITARAAVTLGPATSTSHPVAI